MKSLLVLLAALTLCFTSCKDYGTSPEKSEVRPLTDLEKRVVQASNQFGLHLLKTVNQSEAGKDVFISPLSVSVALGMALNGANGTTAEAMRSTLGFSGMTMDEINRTYSGLIYLLRSLDPKVQFKVANSIWHRLEFTAEQEFVETNRRYFDAVVRGLDFRSPDASATINSWVDANTNGRIREIIPDPIPSDIVMYLINAIYCGPD
jgi:serpin B